LALLGLYLLGPLPELLAKALLIESLMNQLQIRQSM
jgi:hypothetical protein